MTDDNIIFSYTADQAIEDGMLVHPYPKRWPNLLITAGIHEKCRDTSDGRTYDHACALRAVTSTDGMTADIYPFDMAFLSRVSNRIVNEVRGINRVVYDVTSKPPGTIEWE